MCRAGSSLIVLAMLGLGSCLIDPGTPHDDGDDDGRVEGDCGNAELNTGEECDDGNLSFGDGCSDGCRLERWSALLPYPDFSGDAGGLTFDVANAYVSWDRERALLSLGAHSYERGGLSELGIGFLIAPSETSCLYSVIASYFLGTYPVNLFRYCGVEWEELLPPASMDSADSVLDDGDFVVVRFAPAELDPEMADFTAFMALEVFDQTDSDTFPDDGFLVPVVWSLPRCGNGIVEYGELCDDGNVAEGDACPANCGTSTSCGNTVSDPGEECDDGGTAPGDGCSSTCQLESQCGNGTVEDGEECDDGNPWPGDGCSDVCLDERECGNGVVETGEQCDDSNTDNDDGCDENCQREPYCGDGFVITGEVCDDGFTDLCGTCNADCTGPGTGSVCGDSAVCPEDETCDDGNTEGGDACPGDCQ